MPICRYNVYTNSLNIWSEKRLYSNSSAYSYIEKNWFQSRIVIFFKVINVSYTGMLSYSKTESG
jgi:hypothetical protein